MTAAEGCRNKNGFTLFYTPQTPHLSHARTIRMSCFRKATTLWWVIHGSKKHDDNILMPSALVYAVVRAIRRWYGTTTVRIFGTGFVSDRPSNALRDDCRTERRRPSNKEYAIIVVVVERPGDLNNSDDRYK